MINCNCSVNTIVVDIDLEKGLLIIVVDIDLEKGLLIVEN